MPPALIKAFDTDNDQGWNLDEYSTAMQDKSLVAWRRVFDRIEGTVLVQQLAHTAHSSSLLVTPDLTF